jgi:hypothetical protein
MDDLSAPSSPPAVIEIPRRQGAQVVVLPLRMVRSPLTAKERARLEQWVARHLATQTDTALAVVPAAEVSATPAPTCVASLSMDEVLRHTFPQALRARPVADCSGRSCRLSVSLSGPEGASPYSWSADVAEPASFAQWEIAAQALKSSKGDVVPAAESSPVRRRQPTLALTAVRASGPWNPAPELAGLRTGDAAFARCHERGQLPTGPDELVLEIGTDGGVSNCEAQSWRDPAARIQVDCQCQAAASLKFPAGKAGRRLALELWDGPDLDTFSVDGERVTAEVRAFKSTDPAIGAQLLTGARPWLALCFANTRLGTGVTLPAEVELSASGEITSVRVGGEGVDHLFTSCVESYLRYVPLPCTRSGQPAKLDFEVEFQKLPERPTPLAEGVTRMSTDPT